MKQLLLVFAVVLTLIGCRKSMPEVAVDQPIEVAPGNVPEDVGCPSVTLVTANPTYQWWFVPYYHYWQCRLEVRCPEHGTHIMFVSDSYCINAGYPKPGW